MNNSVGDAAAERIRKAHFQGGTISELVAAIDLMRRGYDVFRALSAQSSCDLVAIGHDQMLRIEVRSTTYGKVGKPYAVAARRDAGRFDVYALVTSDGVVHHRGGERGEAETTLIYPF
jgi:hypothetical protein